METSPLPVKGCKILAYARHSVPLSREGSLPCHTCCDTGPRFFLSHPKDHPFHSPLTTHEGMWRIYSTLDPHRSPIVLLLRHTRKCGGPILTRILTGCLFKKNRSTFPGILQSKNILIIPGCVKLHSITLYWIKKEFWILLDSNPQPLR